MLVQVTKGTTSEMEIQFQEAHWGWISAIPVRELEDQV